MDLRVDSHKLQFHPARVAQWQAADTWEKAGNVYPIYVEISPVGACNHRCTFCAVDYIGYQAVMLEPGILIERLCEMGKLGVKGVMFAGEGEPLLHKNIDLIVEGTVRSGIDVSFTTSGTLLNKLDPRERCQWVKVSVNAGTSKTYAAVHRTKERDWDTVWENIGSAVKRKGECMIGVQTLLLPEIQNEIQNLYDLCDARGVDYFVVKPYSQHKFSVTHAYEDVVTREPVIRTNHTQFIFRKAAYETKEIAYEKCQATPNFWAYVMASGEVYSCSAYLLDERFRLGNINTQSFREIWQGEKRKENWRFVREELNIHECRVNCRMQRVNVYLDELTNGVPGRNFI